MQCWFLRVLYSWRSWLVFTWLCLAPLGHSKTPGITNQSNSLISPSSPKQTMWSGEGGLFEGQEYWILPLLLEMNPPQVCGPTEILSPMHNTPDQHQGHPHPLRLITLGESLIWMIPTILGQTMSHPRLLMNCLGGSQPPLGAQPKLFAQIWGRSQKKGRCFSGRNLLLSELSSKKSGKKIKIREVFQEKLVIRIQWLEIVTHSCCKKCKEKWFTYLFSKKKTDKMWLISKEMWNSWYLLIYKMHFVME